MSKSTYNWLVIILGVPATFWQAFAAVQLWAWFIVPQFALAPLTIKAAIGAAMIVGLYRRVEPETEETDQERLERFAYRITAWTIGPALTLLLGFLYFKLLG